MKVDIWSDVRCPFCYIGKKKFENALARFPHKAKVNVIWHSFELDPNLETEPGLGAMDYFVREKGISLPEAEQMNARVVKMAEEVGLDFNMEKTVVANSFNAHRLIQFAKTRGLGNEIEEALFKAHFTDGKNMDDKTVLREIGESIGLKTVDLDRMLFTDEYAKEVREDEKQAQRIGARGVPFFVFDEKYAVSGAQPEDAFLEVLEKSWTEFYEKKEASGS